jgi:hypothetical protein
MATARLGEQPERAGTLWVTAYTWLDLYRAFYDGTALEWKTM